MTQATRHVVIVSPTEFCANPEACADNYFAAPSAEFAKDEVLNEAAALRAALVTAGVQVMEIDPSALANPPNAPDGCFPNNWLMFVDGSPVLCPMKVASRRRERALWPHIEKLLKAEGFKFESPIDLSPLEKDDQFLEGTGSLVLDRVNRIAYAALSERTDLSAAEYATQLLGYRLVAFRACDPQARPVYHTNVLLSIGTKFAVICTEAINIQEQSEVLGFLSRSHRIIEISWEQTLQYCGNILELDTQNDAAIVAMSETAYNAFSDEQFSTLSDCEVTPIYADISTIERVAGGSMRCMLAEVFAGSE